MSKLKLASPLPDLLLDLLRGRRGEAIAIIRAPSAAAALLLTVTLKRAVLLLLLALLLPLVSASVRLPRVVLPLAGSLGAGRNILLSMALSFRRPLNRIGPRIAATLLLLLLAAADAAIRQSRHVAIVRLVLPGLILLGA